MNKFARLMAVAAALFLSPVAAVPAAPTATATAEDSEARSRRIAAQLHPVTGDVRIPQANAVLHLGEDYYFLPAQEARLVLTEGWGNPPEATTNVLGMVFPTGRTFSDDTWGAVVTWDPSGYVSDSDAASMDHDSLLTTLRGDEEAINAARAQQGYPATNLVGWAQPPSYDASAHSLVWALNLRFADQAENTLNYDVRLLGRRGVLSLNMVTVMSKLDETRAAAQRFASTAEFVPGERYADFREGDQVAEYSLAGLIAAGAGAAVAQKAGLFAAILAFGKKFIILIVAGLAALGAGLRRLFRRKEEDEPVHYEEAAPEHHAAGPMPEAAPEVAGGVPER